MKLFTIVFFFLFFAHSVNGQSGSDSLVFVYLNKAKEQMAQDHYSSANNYLKKIFALNTTLPDEVAFYYGKVQINLKNYTKGKEFLEKYLSLTGDQGEFYLVAHALINLADNFICKKCNNTGTEELTDTCMVCKGLGIRDTDCDVCKSNGMEFCNSCGGKGVFIVKGNFGNSYSTCENCKGKGYLECHVCKGTKKKSMVCQECKGKGLFKRKARCNH